MLAYVLRIKINAIASMMGQKLRLLKHENSKFRWDVRTHLSLIATVYDCEGKIGEEKEPHQ
jgi:hypothetical protein